MRKVKLAILHAARALGLFRLTRTLTARAVRVLCYHGAWMGDRSRFSGDCMFIGIGSFAARLDIIRRLGYPVVPLNDAMLALRDGGSLPAGATVITIDDGWYSTYAHMAPALVARGMPATLYCDTAQLAAGQPIHHVMARYIHLAAGEPELDPIARRHFEAATDIKSTVEARAAATRDFAAAIGVDLEPLIASRAFGYMTPEELAAMHARGIVDVQLHTHNHTLHDMSRSAVRAEVEANAAALSEMLGRPPSAFRHFCYPSGVTSPSAEAALGEIGIISSTTTSPGLAFPGVGLQAIPRFLDGENVYPVELEAELSGFMHLLREGIARVRRMVRRAPTASGPVSAGARAAA